MNRRYGILDRGAALAASLALFSAGCGGRGGADEPDADPPRSEGPGELDGPSSSASSVDVAAEVAQRRAQTNVLAASAEVGTISGAASVDATGSARYSIPIDVAPGPGGMQPELALSYDSSSDVGYAGLGFVIDGFGSTIERCQKTIAEDGYVEPIKLELDDALCFGGRRMVLVDGTYGQPGSEYRTRRDPFDKILLLDMNVQSNESRWEVWLSDGRIIEYSGRIGSADPGTVPLKWYADGIHDRYGNNVEYQWTYDSTSIHPRSVRYGDGREVRFEFDDLRTAPAPHNPEEVRSGYVAGRFYEKPYRLRQISVYGGGGAHLWDYELNYNVDAALQVSMLRSVQKCDAAGACLPATDFTWSPDPVEIELTTLWTDDDDDDDDDDGLVPASITGDPDLLAGLAYGAVQMLDLDGNGRDELVTTGFDTDYDILLGWVEGMDGEPGTNQFVNNAPAQVDPLSPLGFAGSQDPTPNDVAIPSRSTYEEYTRNLRRAALFVPSMDPPTWTYQTRDDLAEYVANTPYGTAGDPSYSDAHDDSLASSGSLAPADLPHWMRATPPLWPLAANLFGGGADSLIYPISPRLFGGPDVEQAGHLVVAHGGSLNTSADPDRITMGNYPFDPGFAIHSLIPADHDGNGLTDFWMCRGLTALNGSWVLALNEGEGATTSDSEADSSAVPWPGMPPHMALYDTDVRCSAFDETLVVPLDGTSASSLLVSPAFDPDSDSLTPLSDDQRNDYFKLEYIPATPAGSLQPTSLPRDRFQRWHDQNCRNVAIDAGFPVFGAGPGSDRLVDINADGLVDVLRFELSSGDGHDNLANIHDGLATDWGYRDSCENAPGHQDAGVRAYLNHGDGSFVPQPDFLFPLNGIPHASYYLNWLGGTLLDINGDRRTDFILPIDTNFSDEHSTFTVYYTRPSGDFGLQSLAVLSAWARYDDDNTWKENLERLGGIRMLRYDNTGSFLVLGDRKPSDPGIHIEASRWDRQAEWPRISLIEDGLGATNEFEYGPYVPSAEQAQLPAARMTAPKTVVSEHQQSVGPDEQKKKTCYRFTGPVRDLRSGRFLGFTESVASTVHEGGGCLSFDNENTEPPESRSRRTYDFTYDPTVDDYPYATAPTVSQHEVWLETSSGTSERQISCNVVDSWDVRSANAGATWFSYPNARESFVHSGIYHDQDCEFLANPGDGLSVPFRAHRTHTETRNDEGAVETAQETVEDLTITNTVFSDWLDDDGSVDVDEHWFRGKAQRVEVTSCSTGNGGTLAECETRTEDFVYDAEHAAIDAVVVQAGDIDLELTTQFFRNDHGRVINKTRTDASGNSRVDRFGWDEEGVHLEWSSNPLGQHTYVIHDRPTGALVAQIEPNGNSVETFFDGFLRPVMVRKRETPMGAWSTVYEQLTYAGPTGSESFALSTTARTMPFGQVRVTEVDAHGKTLREQWEGVVPLANAEFTAGDIGPQEHNQVEVFHQYDERGRNIRTSKPTWLGTPPPAWQEWSYDNLNRKRSSVLLDGSLVELQAPETWDYEYNSSLSREVIETYTDQDDKTTVREMDAAGRVSTAYDGEGTPTRFMYGAFGTVRHVFRGGLDAGSSLSTTTYEYDALGRRTSEAAPENGTSSIDYTPFGEIEVVTQPEGTTGFVHDDLGRVTHRVDADGTAQWEYDTLRIGAVSWSTSPDNVTRSFTYDTWGRVDTETTDATLGNVTLEYAYDDHDRLTQITYPEPGYAVFYEYDVFGYHRRSRSQRAPCSLADAVIDWEWVTADASSNVTLERLGNGTETSRGYETGTYRPETIHTVAVGSSPIQGLSYYWSEAGDLDMRTDHILGQSQDFTYDDAHRLRTWNWGGTTQETQYDALGNITRKSGQGTYAYDAATDRLNSVGAHAYTYDDNGNVLTDGERTLTWTPQNKVRSLNRGGQSWSVLYDAGGTRVVREEAAANSATYNVGPTYELRFDGANLVEARMSVLGSTGRVVAEVFAERTALEDDNSLWENRKKFVHDDHLGSTHAVTDRDGAVESRVMYGPWGAARDGENWFLSASETSLDALPAGFTGHQPELDAGLINMRGRMYDPAVGRFMSVDPVIENLLEVGTWNAYSYVQNRPLSLVDPTGLASQDPIDDDGPSFHEPTGDEVADEFLRSLRQLGGPLSNPWIPKANGEPQAEETKDETGKGVEQQESGKCESVDKRWCIIADAGGQIAQASGGGKNAMLVVALISVTIVGAAVFGAGMAGKEVTADEVADLMVDTTEDLIEQGELQELAYDTNCFPAGTQVRTENGTSSIEQIVDGQNVWAFDTAEGSWGWAKVSATHDHIDTGGMTEIRTNKDELLRSTSGHPYCVVSGERLGERECPEELSECTQGCIDGSRWVPAGSLRVGDRLFAAAGFRRVQSTSSFSEQTRVYNLTVASAHTYAVSAAGILVHNMGGSRTLPDLPAVDSTGKVHGKIPTLQELELHESDELDFFREQLSQSIQRRKEVTGQLGSDAGHSARQAAEEKAKSHITKILKDRGWPGE